jgi:hypothetical protein
MRKLIYILLFASLACGIQTNIAKTQSNSISLAQQLPTADSVRIMHVIAPLAGEDYTVYVREAPSEKSAVLKVLSSGMAVRVTEILVIDGTEWCKHADGWTACRWLQ